MVRVVDYRVVTAPDERKIQEMVCSLLAEGWLPQGGLVYIPDSDPEVGWCSQAMVLVLPDDRREEVKREG